MSLDASAPGSRAGRRGAGPRIALLTLFCVTSVLTGCSGSGGQDGSTEAPGTRTTPTASGEASPTSEPALPSDVTPAPVPTKVPNEPAVRTNVVLSSCTATDGGWQATGTATNPGEKGTTYEITVFFTTTSATTINYAKTKVDVAPGKTGRWTAKKSFTAPKEMLCVLRGVATD